MSEMFSKILRDLRDRQHIDVYAVSFIAFALAVLSLVGDIVPEQIRWSAILTGVGILVLRIAIPEVPGELVDKVLGDRFSFDVKPIADRLRNAAEVWVYAPSAVNLLSAQNCEILRTGCLSRPGGSVRIVVLDPGQEAAVNLAKHQLDDSLDYPVQEFADSLRATTGRLRTMSSWQTSGDFDYRFLDYNPGFSLVGIDPSKRNGYFIIEFHGFHNESTSSRMHIEISRKDSDRWYEYWTDQFRRIWDTATSPQPEQ